MLKRYLVFAGETYYAAGGWNDFAGSFDTVGDAANHAIEYVERIRFDWWHVVDSATGKKVIISGGGYGSADEDAPYVGTDTVTAIANDLARKTLGLPPDCDTLSRPPTFQERHDANVATLAEIHNMVWGDTK